MLILGSIATATHWAKERTGGVGACGVFEDPCGILSGIPIQVVVLGISNGRRFVVESQSQSAMIGMGGNRIRKQQQCDVTGLDVDSKIDVSPLCLFVRENRNFLGNVYFNGKLWQFRNRSRLNIAGGHIEKRMKRRDAEYLTWKRDKLMAAFVLPRQSFVCGFDAI